MEVGRIDESQDKARGNAALRRLVVCYSEHVIQQDTLKSVRPEISVTDQQLYHGEMAYIRITNTIVRRKREGEEKTNIFADYPH